ncbi:MAG: DivIVA domain-containing protein [Acidimicrobiia bacterium]|nr:DivIVA domain-containing protein [Acidimicrobiia bacterium]
MADDRIVISSEPGVVPDEIARHSFPVVFRGYDQDQVRRYLKKVSDELAAARQREAGLRQALDEARNSAAHPELDEAALTAALGEETTRILLSAREAAADMRTKAEERVARMVQEADEHGARLRLEAENILARRVEEADEVASNIRAAAEADAHQVHDRVQAELDAAKARGRDMIAEAQAVRERIIGDLARRRRAAQIQIEQLLAGRDQLLETYKSVRSTFDEISAQLEHAEDEARVAAEAAHRRVVNTPADDSDLAAYVAEAPEPEQPTPPPPEPDAWALPEPPVAAPPPSPSIAVMPAPSVEAEPLESPRPSLVRLEPFDEEEGVRIIGPVSQPAPEPELEAELEPEPVVAPTAMPEPEPGPEGEADPEPAAETEHHESVDDLFARLREERQVAVIKAEQVLGQERVEEPAADEAAPQGAEVPAAEEPPVEESSVADADRLLLERRDECLEPIASDLVRRLKRVLQDEQNEILDRLRQTRGRGGPEEALPPAADQVARYRDAAVGPLTEAAQLGASFTGSGPAGDLPAQVWAEAMADELVGGLRERVSRSLAAVGDTGDGNDAADGLGAAYRQWKTERIDKIGRHHLAAAFNEGVLAATPDGSTLRWVFGDAGPCPDCDDNALAGPTAKGEAYPTGQHHPPAHAGCGCLLTAVTVS